MGSRSTQRISKRLVDGLAATGKLYEIRDADVIGFAVRVTPAGAKSYTFQWRDADGKWRREVIGRHGTITPDQARAIAQQWAGVVAGGGDPKPRNAAPGTFTMAELHRRYMAEHAAFKKPRSALNDDGYWRNHILPAMGRLQVREVSHADAAALHLKMRGTPTNANRVLEVLRKAMYLAEIWKLRTMGSNPCKGVKPYRLKKRRRYMAPKEAPRFGAALAHMDAMGGLDANFAALVRLSLFTGARKGEWQWARWDDVDASRGVLVCHDTKSNEEQEIIITPLAWEVLQGIKRLPGNPYIITGKKQGQPLKETRRMWRRLCELAGVPAGRGAGGMVMHDLRHSFASYTVTATGNMAMVTGLLRHADSQTTMRYAHLLDDPLRAAAHTGTQAIAEMMAQPLQDNVVALPVKKG